MNVTLEQALTAQKALRDAAGLPKEDFPVQAFIGMVSDEIEALRKLGRSDEEIAFIINAAAGTDIPASAVVENYASPEERHPKEASA